MRIKLGLKCVEKTKMYPIGYRILCMKSRCVFQNLKHSSNVPNWLSYVLNNHVDISYILSICGREARLQLGSSIHASLMKSPEYHTHLHISNSLLFMYCKCGELKHAAKLFDEMPLRDAVSWNSMISGFLASGELGTGFGYFRKVFQLGVCCFDQATLTTILSKCGDPDVVCVTRMIHALVFLCGYESGISVGNALITSYFYCGCLSSGRQVFDEMGDKNVISWTAVISGLAQNQLCVESLNLFVKMRLGSVDPNSLTYLSSLLACSGLQAHKEGRQIHGIVCKLGFQSDLRIESALMDMYSKCGCIEDALQIFNSAKIVDEVSITVILVAFAQNGYEDQAVHIFVKMVKAGIKIDTSMISALLGVFGIDTSMALGQQIHSLIIKKNFDANIYVSNGLINMYSKCGDLEESIKVFNRMPQRNSITWNSMIAAFARHGNGYKALKLYEEMRLEGVEPTDVTFLSLLHACSHMGLVEKGMEFLVTMESLYGFSPRMEHYASVVDMLGRAGRLTEAKSFIEGLPIKPGVLVWQALLGACSFYGEPEIGKYAVEQLSLAAPDNPVSYILLANIYSTCGRWKERAKTIRKVKEMGAAKETGMSWIEINKEIHSFVVYDQMHPQCENLYKILLELFRHMKDEGYVPDKRFILHYLHENEGAMH